jgi:hypothetical protein
MIASKQQRIASRWIPQNNQPISTEHGTAYISEANGRFSAIAYRGTACKSDWHHSFRTREKLNEYVGQWFQSIAASAALKAERAAARKSFQHTLKVGDILEGSWGYDQTNPEFFQVVEVRGKHVMLRELCLQSVPRTGGFMSEQVTPIKDRFTDKPAIRRLVQQGNNVKLYDFGCYLSPWGGGTAYSSWYA